MGNSQQKTGAGSEQRTVQQEQDQRDAARPKSEEKKQPAQAGTHDFPAPPLPGPVVDTYGAGDSFSAALCFALARGDALEDALALAARAGAAVIAGTGPYATQMALAR